MSQMSHAPTTRRLSYGQLVLATLLLACLMAVLVQLVVGFNTVNLAATCTVFASSVLMLAYLAWTPAIHTHPLSTFALLGFNVTTQMGALLGQSAFGLPIADNLRQPIETFAWLAAFQLVAIATHAFYRAVVSSKPGEHPGAVRRTLERLGLYTPPGTGTLWFMGYLGLFAFVIGSGREGVFGKVLQGMAFMTWAPFLIPMYLMQFGKTYSRWSRQAPQLVFFGALVVLVGLAANSRAVMLSGFMTISLFALLMLLRSQAPVHWSRVGTTLVLMSALAALAIPVSDLAAAMVVARKSRGAVNAVEMVKETLRIYGEPELIEADRAARALQTQSRYDETYFNNVLLARLVETKFHDNAMYFGATLTQSDREQLWKTTIDLFIVALPAPVIQRLGFDIDKRDYKFSLGDYMAHLSQGGPLGSYRTGSMPAHGLALLGPAFLAVYGLACLFVFALLDLLSRRDAQGVIVVSAMGMLSLWDIFLGGVTGESVHGWITNYLRWLPQTVALFLIVAAVGKAFAWLLGGYAAKPRATPARRLPV